MDNMKDETKSRKMPDQKKAATLLAQGESYTKALLAAGYSPNVAKKGRAGVPDKVMRMVGPKAIKLRELGKLSPNVHKELLLGRLCENVLQGKDGGTLSAKALGSTKEIDLFRTESQVGVIVVNAPNTADIQRVLESLNDPEE